jgi:pectate lyase
VNKTRLVCSVLLVLVVVGCFHSLTHVAGAGSNTETLFTTQTPALLNVHVGPYELGTEFTSSVSGNITAIRFWKSSSETGQHIGHIWSASGQLLASATFASETASGWQQQSLASPVAIAANTVYVVSVNTGSNAYYAATLSGLTTQVVNQNLSTVLGNNGVYGPPGQFPRSNYQKSNYFRDIVFSGSSSPVTVPGQSAISVVPTAVSFGGVTLGTTNTQTVTIRNQGSANLTVSQATISGSGFKFSGLQLPMTVAPSNSANFTVSFAPTTTSSATGTLTITSNAPASPTAIALSGTGMALTSQLTASPTSLNFGNVNVGSSSSHTVTLANTGNTSVSVSGDSVTGAGFTISGLTPLSLGAGQSTTFSVNFTPRATGSVSGSLVVNSSAPPAPIALSGTGVSTPTPSGPLAAFPGAEGGGALSVGGRGGAVYEVTNLNDSGSGSLRACVQASGPRTCVFRTGGHISLSSALTISNPYITIAGQTAPGGGIEISDSGGDIITLDTHDIIIRYLRLRMGGGGGGSPLASNHALYNVMVDHVSTAWGVWDNYSVWTNNGGYHNLTLQWSILGEPNWTVNGQVNMAISAMNNAMADASMDFDIHHNFIDDGDHRNPLHTIKTGKIVNNVIYNWNYYATRVKGYKDMIGNYYKPGPMTGGTAPSHEIQAWTTNDGNDTTFAPSLYVAGNAGPHNAYNASTDNWSTLTALSSNQSAGEASSPLSGAYQRNTPICAAGQTLNCTSVGNPGPAITVHSASEIAAANGALLPATTSEAKPGVGASSKLNDNTCDGSWVANRDSVDNRLIAEFLNGTGPSSHITAPGAFTSVASGVPCADSGHDGMTDIWETAHGLTPGDPANSTKVAPNGYTYLENYLNGTDPNLSVSGNFFRSAESSLFASKTGTPFWKTPGSGRPATAKTSNRVRVALVADERARR